MVFNFLIVYFFTGALLKYKGEATIYLYSFLVIGMRIDQYTLSFFFLLGTVGARVILWSYYYMNEEENYKRFFLLLFIFIVRIVILIFFSNLYMSFIGWDALGITSYLIVIYYKNRKRLGSGMITALSNRLGDSFFFLLFWAFLSRIMGVYYWHSC